MAVSGLRLSALAYVLDESDDDRLRDLWFGPHDDRSEAEPTLVWEFAFWFGDQRTGQRQRRSSARSSWPAHGR